MNAADMTMPQTAMPGLRIRKMEMSDLPSWAEFALLPQVLQHTSANYQSLEDLRTQFAPFWGEAPNAPMMFAVTLQDAPHKVIAATSFHTIMPRFLTAELSYDVHPDYWGRGIASALALAMVEWAFKERGWRRVQATAVDSNLASQAVLQKCGFVLEGRLRNFRIIRGQSRDYFIYSRIPGDGA
ncbi:GNAT family protein [Massilia sp. W12]|uniref:GNAT family N-acetyltransferase n=1 Tax=Massilia sp. W12 TaxID=3126507 RepID=UPI0030D133F5